MQPDQSFKFCILSDLHLSDSNKRDFYNKLLPTFFSTFKKFHEDCKAIVILGDIFDKGGSGVNDLQEEILTFQKKFIHKVLEFREDMLLFAVPGNHDVERKECIGLIEKQFNDINSELELNSFFEELEKGGIQLNKKFETFEEIFGNQSERIKYTTSDPLDYKFIYNDFSIQFELVNSAFVCGPFAPSSGLIIPPQYISSIENNRDNLQEAEIKIVFMHHPIQELATFSKTQLLNAISRGSNSILLSGHSHEITAEKTTKPIGSIIQHTVRSGFNNISEKNIDYIPGFSILEISIDESGCPELKIEANRYVEKTNSFVLDEDFASNGCFSTKIDLDASLQEILRDSALGIDTLNNKIDDIDSRLLTNSANSQAPGSINEIFTCPPLESEAEDISIASKKTSLSFDDLIKTEKNTIIYGSKESGKSTLLNKVFSEINSDLLRYGRLSIILPFNTITNKSVEQVFAQFYNVSKSKAKRLISQYGCLIIIDDYQISKSDIHFTAFNTIMQWTTEENITILMTAVEPYEEHVRSEEKSIQNVLLNGKHIFNQIHIKPVGITHFQELAKKWFQGVDNSWLDIQTDKLIKTFRLLNIEKNMFNLSLYLWILERDQKFVPINKSVLVSQYLLYSLDGLSRENISAGHFGYSDKFDILRDISMFMHDEGDDSINYAITTSSTVKCIEEYIKSNQRSKASASEIYADYLHKGILFEINGYVSFRFTAFYEYFVGRNITSNIVFKNRVLKGANCLNYINELEYHAGSTRNDVDLLNFVNKLMKKHFKSIDESYDSEIDQYFPSDSVLVKKFSFVTKEGLKSSKLNKSQKQSQLEVEFQTLPVRKNILSKKESNSNLSTSKLLKLCCVILKSSENVQRPTLINSMLQDIIRHLAQHGQQLQTIFLAKLHDESLAEEDRRSGTLIAWFAALMNQGVIKSWLSSSYLDKPLEKYLKTFVKRKSKASQEEHLLYTAIVARLFSSPTSGLSVLESYLPYLKNRFVLEQLFFLVFNQYRFRPLDSSLNDRYESILIDLGSKASNRRTSFTREYLKKSKISHLK